MLLACESCYYSTGCGCSPIPRYARHDGDEPSGAHHEAPSSPLGVHVIASLGSVRGAVEALLQSRQRFPRAVSEAEPSHPHAVLAAEIRLVREPPRGGVAALHGEAFDWPEGSLRRAAVLGAKQSSTHPCALRPEHHVSLHKSPRSRRLLQVSHVRHQALARAEGDDRRGHAALFVIDGDELGGGRAPPAPPRGSE